VTAKLGTKVWTILLGSAFTVGLVVGCNTEEPAAEPAGAGPAVKAPPGGGPAGAAPGKPDAADKAPAPTPKAEPPK
jgi:hypothetical protein